ncbi:unnamed protein product [marine sediment metagenome]|uniref:Uncharacterized protein n=1 Tax=marine sediment metagenome TaxID=412755 RepID=X0U364_9ZZZZ
MNDALKDVSTDELQAELDQRQRLEEEQAKPKAIASPDFRHLKKTCQHYVDALAGEEFTNGDWKQYIYEAAIVAIFGKDVWDWINSKLR